MLKEYFQKKIDDKIKRGIIVLDKKSGVTSHDEINRLRRIFGIRRIGHSGTLDPKVTGVLVCGLGRGTRVLEYVLLSQKVYDCQIVFHKKVQRNEFQQVLDKFVGTIMQLPPVKSRVKRVERERTVYDLKLLDFAADGRTAHLRCAVERGTYIRKLCHDMGVELGCGAHMGDLRRIQAGPFDIDNSKLVSTEKLERLENKVSGLCGWWNLYKMGKYIESIESVVAHLPAVIVDERLTQPIASGANLFVPGVLDCPRDVSVGDMVQILTKRKKLLAIGTMNMSCNKIQESTRGIAVKIDKVLCG